ncbi:DUF2238 domain-containing protein [bacterium]|nr:DUF2238 domain-containing protein [bacterium]
MRSLLRIYPGQLLAAFIIWWSLLAIAPWYRQDWLLENILVFVAVPALVWGYHRLRFSNLSYTLIFSFFCLHQLGAHYTYSEVPYRIWLQSLFGFDINIVLGIERNHYDRLVHFSFGSLLLPACAEILEARAKPEKIWRFVFPVTLIMAQSELFEIIEWQAAIHFGGPLGQAYLGTQGDIWDAQKDSFAAALGAVLAMGALSLSRRFARLRAAGYQRR